MIAKGCARADDGRIGFRTCATAEERRLGEERSPVKLSELRRMNRNMADKYVSRDDNIHNTLASELPVMGVDRPTARADRQCRYRARDNILEVDEPRAHSRRLS